MELQKAPFFIWGVIIAAIMGMILMAHYPTERRSYSVRPQKTSHNVRLIPSHCLVQYTAKKVGAVDAQFLAHTSNSRTTTLDKQHGQPKKKQIRKKLHRRRTSRSKKMGASSVKLQAKKGKSKKTRSKPQVRIARPKELLGKGFDPVVNAKLKRAPSNMRIKPAPAHSAWKSAQKYCFFAWPVNPSQFWVSSFFGPRKNPGGKWAFHAGVDLAAVRGVPVLAAADGLVIEAAYSPGYGNYVLIKHTSLFKTRYAHLDKILVRVGQRVHVNDNIGRVGSTGFVRKSRRGGSASHLHFEVYMKGKPVNPFIFLA
jgi:murein DD-endopeptidase MepM/ murein hydrolase activator NlpD